MKAGLSGRGSTTGAGKSRCHLHTLDPTEIWIVLTSPPPPPPDPVSRLDLTLVLLAMLSLVVVASLVTVTLLHRRSSWMTRSQIFHGR